MKTIILSPTDIYKGPLLLVNAAHPITTDGNVRLTPLDDNNGIFLETKAASLLAQLFQTVGSNGQIVPVSGYRSRYEQELLYINSLRDNGEAFTNKFVALPDCSEHQTGLAVDLSESADDTDLICPFFPNTGVCADFRALAARYGFIERYGPDKEHLTGIAHEPWHFRYTGYPHSMIMGENNLCLEEYISFIKAYSYTGTHLNYEKTEIFYADADRAAAGLSVPDACTQISGNNVDGFIVTVWRLNI